jgi:hypothetical protein
MGRRYISEDPSPCCQSYKREIKYLASEETECILCGQCGEIMQHFLGKIPEDYIPAEEAKMKLKARLEKELIEAEERDRQLNMLKAQYPEGAGGKILYPPKKCIFIPKN